MMHGQGCEGQDTGYSRVTPEGTHAASKPLLPAHDATWQLCAPTKGMGGAGVPVKLGPIVGRGHRRPSLSLVLQI
jgi:hypothetical protein